MHVKAAAYTLRFPGTQPSVFNLLLDGEPIALSVYTIEEWRRLPAAQRDGCVMAEDRRLVLRIDPLPDDRARHPSH